MSTLPIYLDYAATTPVDERAAKIMQAYLTVEGTFGNPTSTSHPYGWAAAEAIEKARVQVADLIAADPQEILWTSCATESNNLALKGVAQFYQRKGKHCVTCKTEHKSVLYPFQQLERQGFEVTYLEPQANGLIDPDEFRDSLRDDTILASIMHVNNETGVTQDIKTLSTITRERGILFHMDAVQSAGKLNINVSDLPIDLLSFSAHKIYGPKGIGSLFVRSKPRVRLTPLLHGGGQERGLRSGTLPTHQIVGMGEAFALAKNEREKDFQHAETLRERLCLGLATLDGIRINSDPQHSVPHIINISFEKVDGEALMMALHELAVSSGSACMSASIEPSYVLRAMGIPNELAHSAVRFSTGRYSTLEDVDRTIELVTHHVNRLRALGAGL